MSEKEEETVVRIEDDEGVDKHLVLAAYLARQCRNARGFVRDDFRISSSRT